MPKESLDTDTVKRLGALLILAESAWSVDTVSAQQHWIFITAIQARRNFIFPNTKEVAISAYKRSLTNVIYFVQIATENYMRSFGQRKFASYQLHRTCPKSCMPDNGPVNGLG